MKFFSDANPVDDGYRSIMAGDWPPAVRAGEHVQLLWERARQYVDVDIAAKAARSLHPHYWELLLANALLSAEFELVTRAERGECDKGPDLACRTPRLWIEAVAPTGGEGPDAVEGRACRPSSLGCLV